MTLRIAHELGFAAAMLSGVAALSLGDQALALSAWILLIVPFCAWQMLRQKSISTQAGALVGLCFMAVAAFVWLAGTDGAELRAAMVLLQGILAARLLTRRYPSHDLQALLLSLGCMLGGTMMHQGFSYAVLLVVYTVAGTWALLTRQLIAACTDALFRSGNKEEFEAQLLRRDVVTVRFFFTVAAVAWCILLATGFLFLLFPRVGVGGMQLRSKGRLLADSVSLASAPRAQGSDEVMVRLRGLSRSSVTRGLYLRGRSYEYLQNDGFAQRQTLQHIKPSHLRPYTAEDPITYEMTLQQIDEGGLVSLGPIQSVREGDLASLSGGKLGREVAVIGPTSELVPLGTLQAPLRLVVRGYNVALQAARSDAEEEHLEQLEPQFKAAFLQLPKGLDANVMALARTIVGESRPFSERAQKLRQYLLQHYSYTLTQPNSQKADPLAGFLLQDPRGHCEYFATAFAVLLRAAGVPSRVVGGYQGGTWDPSDNTVLFFGHNAHAWVEWFLPGRGWVVDDATPFTDEEVLSGVGKTLTHLGLLWDDAIMQFGINEQLRLMHHMLQALTQCFSPMQTVHRVVTGHADSMQQQAEVLASLAALVLGVTYVVRRRSQSLRGPKLKGALETAFRRLLGYPMPQSMGMNEALDEVLSAGVLPRPAQEQLLRHAVELYQCHRFGGRPLSPDTARLKATLLTLKRDDTR